MGNYLPNPQQSFVSATTQELQEALSRMGPLFRVYSPLIFQHGLSGASFDKALKRPALFRELFDQVGIVNPLHRIVLECRIRNHHAKTTTMAATVTSGAAAIPSNTEEEEDCGDSDSPQDLVHLLSTIETDNKEGSHNYATLYSQPILEHCLNIDILAKLRKLDQWNVVFEELGVTNIMHQNILYNRVLDVANERKRKLQQQQQMVKTTTATTLEEKESETEKADDEPIYEATRNGAKKRQHRVKTTATTLEEEARESEKADDKPIYKATRNEAIKPQKSVNGGGLGRGVNAQTRSTRHSRSYISFKGDSDGRC